MGKIDQAQAAALARVQIGKARLQALSFAVGHLQQKGKLYGEAHQEFSAIHLALVREVNDAWGDYFMFACGPGSRGEETRQEARRYAYQHFLREGRAIMQYLQEDSLPLGGYRGEERDAFQEELNAEFKDGQPVAGNE